ncbi:MAG TPA: AI-2E family transporter YdiK [Acetobacteraceae bacterium]|nr:AI-2E family transporter YdiK [Acetobacteraceae bacterium]
MAAPNRDLVRTTLVLLVVGLLILCSLWIIRPFLPATIWAVTIAVATWRLLLRAQAVLWHSRKLAVTLMTLMILLVFVVPFWLAIATILRRADQLMSLAAAAAAFRVPTAPDWLLNLPLVGAQLGEVWNESANLGLSALAPKVAPYAARLTQWFIGSIGSFGLLLVQFLLTAAITAILYANGETAARVVLNFGHRLAGERGQKMVVLAADAIRAVAIGVMVTALVESAIGGAGLALVGVPLAGVLTAVMFVLCLAQAGPGIVLIPAVIWMYAFRGVGHGTVLLAISLLAITVDNMLRPFLIRKEADLPTLLVLAGVIGGLAAFGLVGIFVGPAVLAVSYTLLQAWMAEDEQAPATPVEKFAAHQVTVSEALGEA